MNELGVETTRFPTRPISLATQGPRRDRRGRAWNDYDSSKPSTSIENCSVLNRVMSEVHRVVRISRRSGLEACLRAMSASNATRPIRCGRGCPPSSGLLRRECVLSRGGAGVSSGRQSVSRRVAEGVRCQRCCERLGSHPIATLF